MLKNIMPIRISNELREEIIELQKNGLSDYRIALMLNLPYSTVHYLRPKVKQRMMEYLRRRYYQERYFDMMADLNEFTNITPNSRYTLLACILRFLEDSKFGLKYSQILKRLK
jgi:orotate phosphoribosyltransferase-like protein